MTINDDAYNTNPAEPPERPPVNWRRLALFVVGALVVVLLIGGGYYFGLSRGQSTSTSPPVPLETSPKSIGLAENASELQKEVEKQAGGKTNLSFTLPADFPKDFPLYPGAKLLSSIRSTQEGLSFLVAWVTDDELDKAQAFYENQLQEKPWNIVTPFSPGMVPSLSRRTLTFTRVDSPDTQGTITLAQETTGRGKTSIRLSYTKR